MVVSVLTIATAAGAQVQTKPKAPGAPTTARAYDKLSLGNQKVASALYQAQSSVVAAIAANGSTPRPDRSPWRRSPPGGAEARRGARSFAT